jgi:hypothetical protein
LTPSWAFAYFFTRNGDYKPGLPGPKHSLKYTIFFNIQKIAKKKPDDQTTSTLTSNFKKVKWQPCLKLKKAAAGVFLIEVFFIEDDFQFCCLSKTRKINERT